MVNCRLKINEQLEYLRCGMWHQPKCQTRIRSSMNFGFKLDTPKREFQWERVSLQ